MAMAISVSRRQWGTGPELLPARALAHRPVARHRVDARRFDPDARDSVSPAATRTAHAQNEGAGEEAADEADGVGPGHGCPQGEGEQKLGDGYCGLAYRTNMNVVLGMALVADLVDGDGERETKGGRG